jgi:uncharacterized protein
VPIGDRLAELLRPEAFEHPARDIRLIETHISWVILAGDYAYKLRKPVNFGFLDFSTLEQRRADCEAEIALNARLSPDLYIGIVDVVERDGHLCFGGPGTPLEPAVCMHRLPESGMLTTLLERGAVDERLVSRLAHQLADFHAHAATGPGVDEYGSVAAIRANWNENFAQTPNVDASVRVAIRDFVDGFIAQHADLLRRRVDEGRIRDGHGDLHAGSVCATRRMAYLFDCVEFNRRFRCADVAAEVAFLAMDLEHFGRADLSQIFIDSYVRASSDSKLPVLLDFYKCYRAFIRGKVLTLGQARITPEAQAYFDLAYAYATRSAQPLLVVIMGLPASGKTTLARALAGRMGLVHLSSDVLRKHLGGLRANVHRFDGFERGLYSRSMTRRTYAMLTRKAARWLRHGQSVVLDASFGLPAERAAVRQLARRTGARLVFVVCRADEGLIRLRLRARMSDTRSTSDARLELWPALRSAFVDPTELPNLVHVDTSRPLHETVEALLACLRPPAERAVA